MKTQKTLDIELFALAAYCLVEIQLRHEENQVREFRGQPMGYVGNPSQAMNLLEKMLKERKVL
jgi:hypothetical protein